MGIKHLFFLFCFAWPAYGLAAEPLLNHFEKEFFTWQSFQASFQQKYHDQASGKTLTGSGQLWFRAPALMRWEYEGEEPYQVIIGKSKIWLIDPLLDSVTVEKASKAQNLPGLAFFFQKESLRQSYQPISPRQTLFNPTAQQSLLAFQPKTPNEGLIELQLLLNHQSPYLAGIAFIDPQGNWRSLRFTHWILNPVLPLQTFEYVNSITK